MTHQKSLTEVTDLAAEFISTVGKSDIGEAGNAFAAAVNQIVDERGWEIESAARRLISCVVATSKRDMSNPRSFLQQPLKEIEVGVKRNDLNGQKTENTMADICDAVSQQKSKIAKAVTEGLSQLDFQN